MAITLDKKSEIVGALSHVMKDAESIVFVNFHKLTVKDTTELRRKLREEGIGYMVAKKTLVKRALDAEKLEGTLPVLEGEIAIAYGRDLIAPARGVYNFEREHKGAVKIVGGVFEGRYMNAEEMMSIATIPGIQTLYGQFVNLINSPIQGFVVALNAIAEKKA
jgi:large subunit ribosomal protein L10